MRILSKKLSNFNKLELEQLNRLTLKGNSLMREEILQSTGETRKYIRVFYVKVDKKIIAWSSIQLPKSRRTHKYIKVYTYVMKKYRQNGFGKRLITAANKFLEQNYYVPRVFAWDTSSFKFFNRCRKIGLPLNVIKYAEVKISQSSC